MRTCTAIYLCCGVSLSKVNDAPIVLFMKGTKLFPSCGFSGTMVQVNLLFAMNEVALSCPSLSLIIFV